ncbi:MAG: rhamnulose-1-phosphate aldolase [Bacteroidales bacterium]|nr:rhamnulose-1-phosphate aldolase [Bacteroidales bacterium]
MPSSLFDPKLDLIFKDIRTVATWLWDRGWAEWGAGNISVNVSGLIYEANLHQNPNHQIYPIPNLSHRLSLSLLTSLSGSRMRQIMKNPEQGCCLVHCSEQSEFSIIPLSEHNQSPSPTSEFASHLLIHETLQNHRPDHKTVLHTHPAEIIALSQISKLNNQEALNEALCNILPEFSIYLPEGIAYIPYLKSGSNELAEASAEAMKTFRVAIWEKHGIIATGPTLEDAFDAIDLVAKAARIWFLIRSAGSKHKGVR